MICCSKCHQSLPETEFYSIKHYTCKKCVSDWGKNRWTKIKDLPETKERSKRYRFNHKEQIAKQKNEYYLSHKKESLQYFKEWARKNKDKRKIHNRRWYLKKRQLDPTYFPKINQKIKVWKTNYTRQYRKKNRAWNILQKLKRRLREKNGIGITEKEVLNQLRKQESKCFYCKKDITDTYTIDHKKPLSKGGENSKENMVLACMSCNSKKGVKDINDFMNTIQGMHE